MKKYLLVASLILSSFSFSQLHSVGFQLGAGGTSLGSSFWNGDSKIKIDFTGGLNYQLRFPSHLTLEARLEYTQFGARIPVQFYDFTGTELLGESISSYDWNYVSVPITVGWQMGGMVRFQPKFGLVTSVLTRSIYNEKPYEGSTLSPVKTSFYSDANKIDIGGIAGAELSIPFKAGVFFLAADFRFSITKVNSDNLFSESFFDAYRHRGAFSVIGLRFTLGNPEEDGPTDIIDDPVD